MRILAIVLGVILIVLAGALWYFSVEDPTNLGPDAFIPSENVSPPTNFNEVGVLHFPPVTSGQGEGTFEYNDGTATSTLTIEMDALSVCAAPNGATPCMAMSITFDKPFDGKTALMEGIRTGDTILVRKMRIGAENEELRSFEPGNIFISWPAALELFRACEVKMATQTHSLDVYLDLKNGSKVRAVEPTIDEMFRVINETSARCGTFPVGTE
jgi:hypothetical protein